MNKVSLVGPNEASLGPGSKLVAVDQALLVWVYYIKFMEE